MDIDLAEIRERIRERLSLAEVMGRDGVKLRRSGATRHVCCCPFHAEKSPSFTVGGRSPDRGHCFGCGWDGDIFSYHQERMGVEFKQALIDLADMCGVLVPPELRDPNYRAPKPRPMARVERLVSGDVEGDSVKPSLPPLRRLRSEECELIAAGRGLSVEAVKCAAWEFQRLAASDWPLYESGQREWLPRSQGAWPSWVVTDKTGNVAEFRRLDGLKYPRHDGGEIKAWSTAGKNWPLGAMQIGCKGAVLLVEGGPDMIAGYHFLIKFGMVDRVAVVCMLGASNSIRESARGLFRGKRVRIMVDADLPKDDENPRKRKMPGLEAAARWTRELTEAGAAVATFCVGPVYEPADVRAWSKGEMSAEQMRLCVGGLTQADGAMVKDVNDLALCTETVWGSESVRRAFCDWSF